MRGPKRSSRERLLDILSAIENARHAVGSMSLHDFSQSAMHRLATERALEIISEASRHLPEDLKSQTEEVPWQDVADIGNVLRHVYEKVDPEIIWSTIHKDFGPLEIAVRKMLAGLPNQT